MLHDEAPSQVSGSRVDTGSALARGSSAVVGCGLLGDVRGDDDSHAASDSDGSDFAGGGGPSTWWSLSGDVFPGDCQRCSLTLGLFASQELRLDTHPCFRVIASFLISSVLCKVVPSSETSPSWELAAGQGLLPFGRSLSRCIPFASVESFPSSAFPVDP